MIKYIITMTEDLGDTFTLVFECFAEDQDHAEEQALKAYPGCNIINITKMTRNNNGNIHT
jgi:hypothetical protein